eukprot:TRINITY_DN270_c0_g1_i1.p1 TRINITY_DN270_c0_g1~~TRINITY_DN270_c0_g1_i1.p1  ORF type:complete len:565 (+),score=103.04 TRINITY_DN270_c0_g1_i1:47-1741(+)
MFNSTFPSFGQPAAPATNPFGTTSATPSFFGNTAAPATNFGANTNTTFGAAAPFGNTATNSNPFGTNNNNNNIFSTTNSTSNPFGGAANSNPFGNTATNSNNLFGGATSNPNPFGNTAPSTNHFGSTTTNSNNPFGGAANSNPFGNTAANSNNPFGTTNTTSGFGTTAFGTSTNANANPFGNTTASSNPFAPATSTNNNPFMPAATTNAPANTGTLFGSTTGFGSTGFGLSNASAPAFTFGTSAATTSSTTGTGQGLSFGATPSTPGFSMGGGGLFNTAPATPTQAPNTGLGGFGMGSTTGFGTGSNMFSNVGGTSSFMSAPPPAPTAAPDNPVNTLLLLRDFFNPESDKCRFRCYFYNLVENAHTLPKPPNFNDALWESAQRNNPDRTRLYPVQAVGYQDLYRRMETQRQVTASHRKCLTTLGQHVEKIEQKHNLETLPRVELLKQTLEESNHRILKLVVQLEVLRRRGQMTTEDEEIILAQLEKLNRSLNHLTGLRQRVNDLFTLARAQSVDPTPTFLLNPDMEAVIFEILEQQRDGLGQLCSIVNHDIAQVDQLSSLVSKK